MSFTKLSRLCALLLTVSLSAWTVGCGSPASNAPEKPAATDIPAGDAPAADAPAEAGSSTGDAGAEVPEGGEEPAKKAE
ncbi:hypothetical protein Pan241w_05730 [Gimesia alba]|uniref:Uncharacterized protein n=1 Tax=Gimesia alba TaxID=2527973 RepID=A0A517R9E6_9PLAN|nr:hypothetical protein [Gimesia alba]QDT40516.1 hypothetical protein Pan241w_05730 [Gimesia alba]